ncbi:MAG: hypothetical protein WAN48_09870 [Actinomycetes bacterium]
MSERPDPIDPLRGWVDDDLADRAAGVERVDIDVMALELAAAQAAGAAWVDRAVTQPESVVSVGLLGAADEPPVTGRLSARGDGWLAIRPERGDGDVVVAEHAVVSVSGLSRLAVPETSPALRGRSLGSALRSVAATGATCTVQRIDGVRVVGTLTRVGGDAVDLVTHPADRAPTASDPVVTVPFTAVAAVRT